MMYPQWQRFIRLILIVEVLVGLIAVPPVLTAAPRPASLKTITFNPPNRGAPGKTQDAGSRPACPTSVIPFTALVPATNWGETIASHPTFWLYFPYDASAVILTLRDEQTPETVIYSTTFQPSAAGIAQVPLPANAPALEVDRLYRWQFEFICDAETQSHFQVTGVVVRRSPSTSFTEQLEAASPTEQVALLAAHGFWHDTLTQLNQLRWANPENPTLQADWETLLQHPFVKLDALIAEPLIECCS
ncbi:MAG: DUF928 domain-containing protein [Leptolyngbyaceae cyanobacterium SL_7_1]|nr:DUF928 domain-containing protein [Leptolyngbyaceae cyanobacterium SL_7_1]